MSCMTMLHTTRVRGHAYERGQKFEHVSPCLTSLAPIVCMNDIRGTRRASQSVQYDKVVQPKLGSGLGRLRDALPQLTFSQ